MTEVLAAVQDGRYVEPSRLTLGQYLVDHWLPALDRRPTTVSQYRHVVTGWIVPAIGGVPLAGLTPRGVQGFYDSLRGAERKNGSGPISDRTRQLIATILHKALQDALELGYVPRNPAAAVKRPTAKRPEMTAWSAGEASAFLRSVEEDRLYSGWVLLTLRGLRRGELLGLRWQDLDLEARSDDGHAVGRLAVRQTLVDVGYEVVVGQPKTSSGRRTVPLDPDIVKALKVHRRRQLEERMGWGTAYTDSGLVFTREDGTAVHPQRLSQLFERLVRQAGLRRIRLHDLRVRHEAPCIRAG